MNSRGERVKFLLNWNRFSDHLTSCMTKLLTDSSYSDVIIATSDKHMICAHKFVLANSSKYFSRLLKLTQRQRGQLVVALPEIKYEIFKILMNYMYKGETQVPHELLPSVIKAGRVLEINGLTDLTEPDNAPDGAGIMNCKTPDSRLRNSAPANQTARPEKRKHEELGTLHEKLKAKKVAAMSPRFALQLKGKTKCQNIDIDSTSEPVITEVRPKVPCKDNEKKSIIQLPLKRVSVSEFEKECPSSSTENLQKKQVQKPHVDVESPPEPVTIKEEKEDDTSWEQGPSEDVEEEITIKSEVPDQNPEQDYNELQCEYCQQTYSNPSEWVRHMTEHHGDQGYETYKEQNKEVVNEAPCTCVICSAVLQSAEDWAKHLKVLHTDKELAVSNIMAASKKIDAENKKKDGENQLQGGPAEWGDRKRCHVRPAKKVLSK